MGTSPVGRIPAWKWGVVWLMFLATLINYMDRQALGNTARFVKADFGLTNEGYGWVNFAFNFTFATFQILAGYLCDRFSLRWLYAGGLLLWSAAGFFTGLATTLETLILCRILLAVGESVNWPCAGGAVRRIMPPEARSLANGIFHGGSSIGAILTPLLVLAIVLPDGTHWRWVFMVVGGVGALWAVAWLGFVRGPRAAEVDRPAAADDPAAAADPVPFLGLFRRRRLWVAILVGVSVNVCWHFYREWLPLILEDDLKFTNRQMQWLTAGFYLAADFGGMGAGWLTRRLVAAGWAAERARQAVMFGTAGLCLLSAPGALVLNPWVTVPLFYLVAAGAMGGFPNYFALTQDVSPRHTAQIIGFSGAVSWYCVAAVSPAVGKAVDALGTFKPLIVAIGCVPLAGACVGLLWPANGSPQSPPPRPPADRE